jgi:hypothetical protein
VSTTTSATWQQLNLGQLVVNDGSVYIVCAAGTGTGIQMAWIY